MSANVWTEDAADAWTDEAKALFWGAIGECDANDESAKAGIEAASEYLNDALRVMFRRMRAYEVLLEMSAAYAIETGCPQMSQDINHALDHGDLPSQMKDE